VSVGLRTYAVAVAAVAGVTVLALALRPALQGAVSPLFLAAVIVACAYGGWRPGFVATALSLIITEAVFPPFFSLDTASVVRAGAFAVVGLLTALLFARARDARARAEALARAREELLRHEQAARADAETAGRSRDEFLATLSHELRTPLNALMGWIWWLRRGSFDEERRERALETIERNTTSLARLIEDLLDISRIITGKLRISASEVEPAAVVAAAVEAVPTACSRSSRTSCRTPSSSHPTRAAWISRCAAREARPSSRCGTRARAFPPRACRTSSIDSVRPTRAGRSRVSASACRSSATSSRCTAGRSARRAPVKARARPSR